MVTAVVALFSLLVLAVLLGRWEPPCPDPGCARVHADHLRAEEIARKEALEVELHKGHSRDWPSKNCTYCQGGGWER